MTHSSGDELHLSQAWWIRMCDSWCVYIFIIISLSGGHWRSEEQGVKKGKMGTKEVVMQHIQHCIASTLMEGHHRGHFIMFFYQRCSTTGQFCCVFVFQTLQNTHLFSLFPTLLFLILCFSHIHTSPLASSCFTHTRTHTHTQTHTHTHTHTHTADTLHLVCA